MRSLLSKEQVSDLIGNHFNRFANVTSAGVQDYLNILKAGAASGIRTRPRPRTVGSFIHDQIEIHARNEFEKDQDMEIIEYDGTFVLLIAKKALLRFKKMNAGMKASNAKTEKMDQWYSHQLTLPGIESITCLTVGYVLDETETFIKNIFLTFQIKEDVIWYKDLHGEVEQVNMFGSVNSTDETEELEIRVKKQQDTKTGTDNNGG